MYNFDSNNYVEYIILGTAVSVTAWTGIRFVKTKSKFSEHAKVFKTLSAAAQKVVGEFEGLMKNHQAVADVKSDFEPIEGLSNTIQSCMRFLHSKFGESLVKTSEKIGSIFVKSLDASEQSALSGLSDHVKTAVNAVTEFTKATEKLEGGVNLDSLRNELKAFESLDSSIKAIDIPVVISTMSHLPNQFYHFVSSTITTGSLFAGFANGHNVSTVLESAESFLNFGETDTSGEL